MKDNKIQNKILSVLFIIFIFLFLGLNSKELVSIFKIELSSILNLEISSALAPSQIEDRLNSNFSCKMDFIDLNGLAHKALLQKEMNGAVRAKNNNLFLDTDMEYQVDKNEVNETSSQALSIMKHAKKNGSNTLYIRRPHKFIEGRDEFPYGYQDNYNDFYMRNFNIVKSGGIKSFDLVKSLGEKLEFYKTDHHWTGESALYASELIVKEINELYDLNLDETLYDINQYNSLEYNNSFLGSIGVKTGKYFVGKDDFNILVPKFRTNLEYKHYINHKLEKSKKGAFLDAFIDKKILDDVSYNNKYNTFLNGGYVENIINNKNANNNHKILIISDSFARPLTQYLSLAFKEARYLDPQEGRYNDSYIEYINKYKPDVVVMMYSGGFKAI